VNSFTASPPPAALEVARTLREAGHRAWFAGGCVRDWVLGRPARDIDLATSARPDQILRLFPGARGVGKAFGVVQVRCREQTFDVATFRTDHVYLDGRHPQGVSFASDAEDARRRDFTINGMFYDPDQNRIIDYVDGLEDIRRRVIRTIGPPAERFREDFLRMLRAVRFAAVLEFQLDPGTFDALRDHAHRIAGIRAERIANELTRMLVEAPRAGDAVRMLHRTRLLPYVLPEVEGLVGQAQPPEFHPEGDVFTHTVMMLDRMPPADVTLAYAVLLHDIGKPATATTGIDPDGRIRIRFPRHAEIGAAMAEEILQRLRCSNQLAQDVCTCVRNHMQFIDVPRMKPSTLRRMMARPIFPTELELHRLDCLCSHGRLDTYDFLTDYARRHPPPLDLPERWITGHDVLAFGVRPGPQVGHWLEATYRRQLDGEAADPDELREWLGREIQSRRDGLEDNGLADPA
jgi:poly(A) polymerase